jgi:hypothetical protein
MFEADAGAGFDEASSDAYAIPFLRILQSNSAQCKRTEPTYIKGAGEGDFYNTVTEKLYSNETGGVNFVPCYFRRVFNLWLPRAEGGGFKGVMSEAAGKAMLQNCTKDEKNHDITPDGFLLVDTREHYGLVVDADSFTPVMLPLASTQVKYSKKWMGLMQGHRLPNGAEAPMFSHMYILTTLGQSNDEGTWAVIKVTDLGYVQSREVYEAAKAFREIIRSGQAQLVEDDVVRGREPGDEQPDDDVPY